MAGAALQSAGKAARISSGPIWRIGAAIRSKPVRETATRGVAAFTPDIDAALRTSGVPAVVDVSVLVAGRLPLRGGDELHRL